MKKYDMKLTEENLVDSIKKDYLGRNKKLSKLIDILNSLSSNVVISIDGNWGTGKTIFVKQLELINKKEDLNVLNKDSIKKFKANYSVFYYNAWENDMHDSPLLSIIYNLINEYPDEKKQSVDSKVELPFNLKELLKSISGNLVDLDKFTSFEDISNEIFTTEKKRNALNQLLENIISKDKKLLFIIDELDRCKPSFAVNLLETLKHFFNNDSIVFIISTNNEQLSHTINNYYGNNFDGYSYLNKFYDLILELDEIDTEKYLGNVFNINKTSQFSNYSLFSVIDYFKLDMRKINRILSDYDLLSTYFNTSYAGIYDEDLIVKHIFLPYCLGLKVHSRNKLSLFLNGKGLKELLDFVMQEEKIKRIVEREILKTNIHEEKNKENIEELVTKRYNHYFTKNKDDTYELDYNKQRFLDTFSLLGNFTKTN